MMEDFFRSFADPKTQLPIIDEDSWQGILETHGIDVVKKDNLCFILTKFV